MNRLALILLLILALPSPAQTTRPAPMIYLCVSGIPKGSELAKLPTVVNMGQGFLNDTYDDTGVLVKRENNQVPLRFAAVEEKLAKYPKGTLVLWNWEPNDAVDHQFRPFLDGKRKPYENDAAIDFHIAALKAFRKIRPDLKFSSSEVLPLQGADPWRERDYWAEHRRLTNRIVKEVAPLCDWLVLGAYYDTNTVPGVTTHQEHITRWYNAMERKSVAVSYWPANVPVIANVATHYFDGNTRKNNNPIPGDVFWTQMETLTKRAPVDGVLVFGYWEKDNQWEAVLKGYLK